MSSKKAKAPARQTKGLARLIENTMDKTEAVVGVKFVTQKLQDLESDLEMIVPKDLNDLMPNLRQKIGTEMADGFKNACDTNIRQVTDALTQAIGAITNEIARLERAATGEGDTSDMAMDLDAPPPADAPAPEAPEAGEDDLAALDNDDPNAVAPDVANPEDDALMGAGPAGRARKESQQVRRRGRKLNEYTTNSFQPNMAALEHFSPSAYNIAQYLHGLIADADVDEPLRRELALALSSMAGSASSPLYWTNPTEAATKVFQNALLDPNKYHAFFSVFVNLAGRIQAQHTKNRAATATPGMHESTGVRKLRESKNPDALVFGSVKRLVREGATKANASRRVAKYFGIDVSDVAAIMREGSQRPFDGAARGPRAASIDEAGFLSLPGKRRRPTPPSTSSDTMPTYCRPELDPYTMLFNLVDADGNVIAHDVAATEERALAKARSVKPGMDHLDILSAIHEDAPLEDDDMDDTDQGNATAPTQAPTQPAPNPGPQSPRPSSPNVSTTSANPPASASAQNAPQNPAQPGQQAPNQNAPKQPGGSTGKKQTNAGSNPSLFPDRGN